MTIVELPSGDFVVIETGVIYRHEKEGRFIVMPISECPGIQGEDYKYLRDVLRLIASEI